MKNETQAIKLAMAGLPDLNAHPRTDPNLTWVFKDAVKQTVTFVCVESPQGVHWELVDTTMYGFHGSPGLFAFKSGPVYEAEAGLRTVQGRRLGAEDYITRIRSLEPKPMGSRPYQVMVQARFSEAKQDRFFTCHGYEWDRSGWTIKRIDGHVQVEFELNTLEKAAFVNHSCAACTLQLVPFPAKPDLASASAVGVTQDLFV